MSFSLTPFPTSIDIQQWITKEYQQRQGVPWNHSDRYKAQQILPRIHLGPIHTLLRQPQLLPPGLTHAILVHDPLFSPMIPLDRVPSGIEGHVVELKEAFSLESMSPAFHHALELTHHILTSNSKNEILLCCMGGVSASPGVAIAALMGFGRMSFDDALKWVLTRRMCVALSERMMRYLKEYEPIAHATWGMPRSSSHRPHTQRRAREENGRMEEEEGARRRKLGRFSVDLEHEEAMIPAV